MSHLNLQFSILRVLGFWEPSDRSSPMSLKLLGYRFFTCFMMLCMCSFNLTQILDLAFNVKNVDEFIGNSFMLLTIFIVCCKMANALQNRRNILRLLRILQQRPCELLDQEELEIQKRFDRGIRRNTLVYGATVEATVLTTILKSLLFEVREQRLPFRAWFPFDHTSSWSLFALVYVHQTASFISGSFIDIAYETLICGFMLQACAQLEILEHRLKKRLRLTNAHQDEEDPIERNGEEAKVIVSCVQHHNCIYRYARKVNGTFNSVIFLQFTGSSFLICSSLYQMVKNTDLSLEFMSLSFYWTSLMVQIFIYCWYGNEVLLKSLELGSSIFRMDWSNLSVARQKDLLIVMSRVSRPIQFTSGSIVFLNLSSFTALLKLSYSAYNLLQKLQKE